MPFAVPPSVIPPDVELVDVDGIPVSLGNMPGAPSSARWDCSPPRSFDPDSARRNGTPVSPSDWLALFEPSKGSPKRPLTLRQQMHKDFADQISAAMVKSINQHGGSDNRSSKPQQLAQPRSSKSPEQIAREQQAAREVGDLFAAGMVEAINKYGGSDNRSEKYPVQVEDPELKAIADKMGAGMVKSINKHGGK